MTLDAFFFLIYSAFYIVLYYLVYSGLPFAKSVSPCSDSIKKYS